jgi:hypothetical protein
MTMPNDQRPRPTTSSVADIYNFRQVTPDLAASGQPREHQLAAIADAGCMPMRGSGSIAPRTCA